MPRSVPGGGAGRLPPRRTRFSFRRHRRGAGSATGRDQAGSGNRRRFSRRGPGRWDSRDRCRGLAPARSLCRDRSRPDTSGRRWRRPLSGRSAPSPRRRRSRPAWPVHAAKWTTIRKNGHGNRDSLANRHSRRRSPRQCRLRPKPEPPAGKKAAGRRRPAARMRYGLPLTINAAAGSSGGTWSGPVSRSVPFHAATPRRRGCDGCRRSHPPGDWCRD